MAASLGLSHETFYSYPASSPSYFPPLVAADSAAVALSFPPPAVAGFPELEAVRPPGHSAPTVFAGGAGGGNETNMYRRFPASYRNTGDDDGARRVSRGSSAARIGFRTRSEVEVMDDGFRWRKYGKKAVKSSPNPRNYYRCSVEGCGVKKRVERDRDDPRYVLTTYDGVHNHAAPGGSHLVGGGASLAAAEYSATSPWSELPPTGRHAAAPAVGAWAAAPVQLHAAAHSSDSSF